MPVVRGTDEGRGFPDGASGGLGVIGSSDGGAAPRTKLGGRGLLRELMGFLSRLLFVLQAVISTNDAFVWVEIPRSSYIALAKELESMANGLMAESPCAQGMDLNETLYPMQ
jgi:hypothetical protein